MPSAPLSPAWSDALIAAAPPLLYPTRGGDVRDGLGLLVDAPRRRVDRRPEADRVLGQIGSHSPTTSPRGRPEAPHPDLFVLPINRKTQLLETTCRSLTGCRKEIIDFL